MERELNVGWAIAIDTSIAIAGVRRNYWCGPRVGWTNIPSSAVVYTTREIAERAAKMVFLQVKRVWPNHMRPLAVRFPT